MLKKEDIEIGQYYYMVQSNDEKWLIETSKNEGHYDLYGKCIAVKDNGSLHRGGPWGDIKNLLSIRKATSFESKWLKQSIKENRYVPKDQVKWKSSYEIYY